MLERDHLFRRVNKFGCAQFSNGDVVQLLLLRQTFQKGGKFKDKYLLVGGVSRFFVVVFALYFLCEYIHAVKKGKI